MKDLPLKQRLYYLFPVLLCFCMPFGSRFLSLLIAGWVLTGLFHFNTQHFLAGLRHRGFLGLVVFFGLTAVSALLSKNTAEAAAAIEIKLGFLIFPVMLFCFPLPLALLKRCIVAFVSGCFFACLLLVARAFYFYMQGHSEYFFYSSFSYFIHASYFAMYLIMAMAFCLILFPVWFKTHRAVRVLVFVYPVVFVLTVFLCASKLGLISLLLTLPLVLAYKYQVALTPRRLLAGAVMLIMVFTLAYFAFPKAFQRLESISNFSFKTIDKTSVESTAVRVLIWQEAVVLVKHNIVFGTGVGDANDRLYEAYSKSGMTGAYEHRLNAHSQYLQTAVGMGLIGFVAIVAITWGLLLRAARQRLFFCFLFALLVSLNFFVESMLQTAAGVIFFAFFYCFFYLVNEHELEKP